MDLGLGSADNINGSRLTEVPLQWTVCLCIYSHTLFFKIQFKVKITKSVYQADAIQVPSSSCFKFIWPPSRMVQSKSEVLLV